MPLMPSIPCPALQPAISEAGLARVRRARQPRPDGLAYSFTVPGDPHCAPLARVAVRAVLSAHGLASDTETAALAVTELLGTAVRWTPQQEIYLSIRYRFGALRLVVWDQHPRHRDPDAVTLCEVRRLRSLWLLAALAEDREAEWGVAQAVAPHRGTRSWITLPCPGGNG